MFTYWDPIEREQLALTPDAFLYIVQQDENYRMLGLSVPLTEVSVDPHLRAEAFWPVTNVEDFLNQINALGQVDDVFPGEILTRDPLPLDLVQKYVVDFDPAIAPQTFNRTISTKAVEDWTNEQDIRLCFTELMREYFKNKILLDDFFDVQEAADEFFAKPVMSRENQAIFKRFNLTNDAKRHIQTKLQSRMYIDASNEYLKESLFDFMKKQKKLTHLEYFAESIELKNLLTEILLSLFPDEERSNDEIALNITADVSLNQTVQPATANTPVSLQDAGESHREVKDDIASVSSIYESGLPLFSNHSTPSSPKRSLEPSSDDHGRVSPHTKK